MKKSKAVKEPKELAPLQWSTIQYRLGDLEEWDKNPATIEEKEAQDLAASLDNLGYVIPFVAAAPPNGKRALPLVDGHQRKLVDLTLRKVSPDQLVDVRIPNRPLTEEERGEAVIRLRKNVGHFVREKLLEFPEDKLLKYGFTKEELNFDFSSIVFGEPIEEPKKEPKDSEPKIDQAKELLKKWKVKPGDLFMIGSHRLICGDCTDPATIGRLMDGNRADLMLTSPPYHVGKAYEKEDSWDDFVSLIGKFIESSLFALSDSFAFVNFGDSYVHPELTWHLLWRSFLDNGFVFFDYRAWKRPAQYPIYVTTQPRSCPELEFLHTYKIGKPSMRVRDLSISARGVWETGGPEKLGHDAAMPVELAEMAMKIYTDSGSVIYEPFSGSGTTLVAAQNLGRVGYGIEISPAYCSVTLQRMSEAFPDLKIERVNT